MPKIFANRGLSNSTITQTTPLMTGPFGELRVSNRTLMLDVKSMYGLSTLRDNIITTSGGTIVGSLTTNTGENLLATTATVGSSAVLQTNERGSYQSGYGMEAGIAIRFGSATPAGVIARWGYYDGTNGYYFQWDSVNKLSINVMKNSSVTQVVQANFNTDILDGTGPSGVTLDMTRGIIYHITMSWYGYGAIIFGLIVTDNSGNTLIVPVHQISIPQGTSTSTPNQPVRVQLINVSGNTAYSALYVGGRQVSVLGNINQTIRSTGTIVPKTTYNANGAYVLAFRKKTAFAALKCFVRSLQANTQALAYVYVFNQCIVTGGTWTVPTNSIASETGIEVNTGFSVSSVGVQVFACLADNTNTVCPPFDQFSLTDTDVMVVSVQALAGTGNQNMTAMIVNIAEYW
jgi:hypothetical protein